MIETIHGKVYVYCDCCGHSLADDYEYFKTFGEALLAKKSMNWKSVKHNGQWEDRCNQCQSIAAIIVTSDI